MESARLKAVITDQRNDIQTLLGQGYIIERERMQHLHDAGGSSLIKVVTGVRRAGKSVFALQMLRDRVFAYLNFDDERLAGMKTSDLDAMLGAFYELQGEFDSMLLDEVQNVAGWELFVNRLQRSGKNVTVTGSNAGLLGGELATHLTGRHIPIAIYPFSFREFLQFRRIAVKKEEVYGTKMDGLMRSSLNEYMKLGGFPEVVRGAPKDYLRTLYASIITRDVVARYGIRSAMAVKEIANYLVSNYSRLMSYNRLRHVAGLQSTHTAKNYVEHLREAYLFLLLDKFSPKYREVVRSPKKVYVIDPGLIHAVEFGTSDNLGLLMENVVAMEFLRRNSIAPQNELYYWRDYQEHEIDFVLKSGPNITELIQVTYAVARDEIDQREITSLTKGAEMLKCKRLWLLTWGYRGELRNDGMNIRCVPLWEWLLFG